MSGRPSVVTRFPHGSLPRVTKPGDFFLVCDWDEDYVGRLIRAGQRVDHGNVDAARWSHSGCVVSADGAIAEANAPGVQLENISKYEDADLWVVSPSTDALQRDLAVRLWLSHVGARYDYLDFVGLALQALLGVHVSLHSTNRFICSGLVSRGTEKYVVGYPLPPEVMKPADLAVFWGVRTDQPIPALSWFDRVLDVVASVRRVANLVSRLLHTR